ncbi:hypothetical protein [Paenibacillus durus]|uniref:Uncharacterized protein n=1 Tax=Paenibacillus durus ATCC 35681 TaxID=1333534 RepID=A0A0F7F7G3_PAEDU|nr:hypothetical protein [Paenibacillus durus]AKG34067.1 hypothetical protein VK70_05305 [Paenibacillus durus ATCC 35681]
MKMDARLGSAACTAAPSSPNGGSIDCRQRADAPEGPGVSATPAANMGDIRIWFVTSFTG